MIVLCIAAGVTAYELANPKDNVFVNLPGFTPEEDPIEEGNSQNQEEGGTEGSGPGGSGLSSNNGGSGISFSEAKNIANNNIMQEGHYAGEPTLNNGNWYVPVLDSEGNVKGHFEIDSNTGQIIGGAGGVAD